MNDFGSDSFDNEDFESGNERLQGQAEDLMRQGRFPDAVKRYQDLRQQSPDNVWVHIGLASALECAGETQHADQILDEAAQMHRRHRSLHRFRQLFYIRREDYLASRRAKESLIACSELSDLTDITAGAQTPITKIIQINLQTCSLIKGRYHEAVSELELLLNENGSSSLSSNPQSHRSELDFLSISHSPTSANGTVPCSLALVRVTANLVKWNRLRVTSSVALISFTQINIGP